jgi:4-amino-4-deoxy-L-arabinose transferase-like glycosyltransferase
VIYVSSLGRLGIDEATWGLMARHAVHGELSAFFWGQSYGGTQEVLPVAALFGIFGTHLIFMRVVPIAFSVAAALVLRRVARRLYGELAGTVAALLVWIWPIFAVWKMEIWSGFYGAALLYVALILLLTLALDEEPTNARIALMGLVLGLSLWESVQTLAIILPALAWLTIRLPRIWLRAWIAVPGLVLGGLPWLLSNLRHDWWSLSFQGSGGTYESRLHGFVSATFPMALGLRVPYLIDWTLGTVPSVAAYAAALLGLAAAAWRWRTSNLSLLPFTIVAFPFLYAINGMTSSTLEPRYVVVLLPVLVLALAAAATTVPRAGVILALAGLLSVVGLVRWVDWNDSPARAYAFNDQVVGLGPTIAALDRAGVTRAYASYPVADRLTFDTRERIIASEADLTHLAAVAPGRVLPPVPTNYTEHHHPAYDRAVRSAHRFAYIFVRREPFEAHDVALLVAHGYRRANVGTVILLFSPPQP